MWKLGSMRYIRWIYLPKQERYFRIWWFFCSILHWIVNTKVRFSFNFPPRRLIMRWTVRGTFLQTILDNWAAFLKLWDYILEGKVDSKIRSQVTRVETQKQSFFNTTGSCFYAYRQLVFFSTIHTRHIIKVNKLQKYVFQHCKVWDRGS